MKMNSITELDEINKISEAFSGIESDYVRKWFRENMSCLNSRQIKRGTYSAKNIGWHDEKILNNRDYKISILNDYSRLDEIYRLTHDTFVASGEILPQDDGMIVTCSHLDNHPNTNILIAEQKGKIIGTVTATIDSEIGLNVENWFEKEIYEYRRVYSCKLSSCWRLATVPSFRGNRKLIVDLIGKAFNVLLEAGCNICFFVIMSKHIKNYQRLIDAKVIATKNISFHRDIPMEINLMEINLEEGWNKFKRLKKNN